MTIYYASLSGLAGNSGLTAGEPKTLAAAISAAVANDTIRLADGRYPGFVLTGKTIIFEAQNPTTLVTPTGWTSPHPARGTRHVQIEGVWLRNSPYCDFKDIHFICPLWIDTTDGTHTTRSGKFMQYAAGLAGKIWGDSAGGTGIVDYDSTSHRPRFYSCESSWGYGPTQAPFDPLIDYPEYDSGAFASSGLNVSGRGDTFKSWWMRDDNLVGSATPTPNKITGLVAAPNGRAYNTLTNGPSAFVSLSASSEAAQFYKCYIHDISTGITAQTNNKIPVIDQCWFNRIYKDQVFTAISAGAVGIDSGLQMTRNIFENPFGYAFDSGNPHCDILQHFAAIPPDPMNPPKLRNFWIERNVYLQRPENRAGGQYIFLQGVPGAEVNGKVKYTGIIVRDNWAMQMNSDKGVIINKIEDGDVVRNMLVTAPGGTSAISAAITLQMDAYTKFAGMTRVKDNISEAYNQTAWTDNSNNISTGKSWAGTPYSTMLTGTYPPAQNTVKSWYDGSLRKGSFTGKGPKYATIENMTLDALTTADIVPYVGFKSISDVLPGTTQTSDKSLIRGPIGTNVTVAVNKGTFRITDATGTVVTDWNSASTTAAVGNYIELRHTSSSDFNSNETQVVTLTNGASGATAYNFKSSTQLNIPFPRINLANSVTPAYNGPLAANNDKAMLVIQFRATTLTTSSGHYLFGTNNNNTSLRARIVATDVVRINVGSVAGGPITGNWDSVGTLGRDKTWLLIVAVDMSVGGKGIAAKLYDKTAGVNLSFTSPTVNPGSVMDFASTSGTTADRAINFGTPGSQPDIDFIWMKTGVWIDPNDSSTPLLFSAAKIGANGEGPTGSLPEIFEVGNAAAWNDAAGLNLGTAAKLKMPSGQIASDVAVNPWPPVLTMRAEIQTVAPYVVGEPIDFLITTAGTNRAYTLTPHSSKLGTWPETTKAVPNNSNGVVMSFIPAIPGDYTFTFANDVGYTAPDPIMISVIPLVSSYRTLPQGTPVTLTKTQWEAMKLRTVDDTPATDLGPVTIAYKSLVGDTGPEQQVSVSYDIIKTIFNHEILLQPNRDAPLDLSLFTEYSTENTVTVSIPEGFPIDLIYPTEQ